MVSALCGEQPGQRRQNGAVCPGRAWPSDLTAQDHDLVSEYKELGVLGRLAAAEQGEPTDDLAEAQVKQSQRLHGWRSSPTSATGAKQQVNAADEILGTHTLRTTSVAPTKIVTDQAPAYPAVPEELLPASWHRTDQYANNRVEADHGRLKARLRPLRGSSRVAVPGS